MPLVATTFESDSNKHELTNSHPWSSGTYISLVTLDKLDGL